MKLRIAVLLACIVLFWGKTYSQEFQGSFIGGINTSQVGGDHMHGFNKLGIFFGPSVKYPLEEGKSLELNILYTQKGSARLVNDGKGGDWDKLTLHYIEVPILFDYMFREKWELSVGVSASYLMGTRLKIFNLPVGTDLYYKKYDFSLVGGINYQLSEKVGFLLRYSNSLVSFGRGKSNPFWKRFNTGYINVVLSGGVRYYF